MAKKPLSAAQKAALARGRATRDANRAKNPQTNTPSEAPQQQTVAPASPQLITLTPEQLNELVGRLTSGQVTDKAPAPSLTPGVGMFTNSQGQIVGTKQKFDPNPELYPSPVERLLDEPRLTRFSMRENYFISYDVTSKPYETKFGYSVVEPFFHLTLYANEFDDQGDATDRAIIIQTLHFNEDEQIAMEWAQENEFEPTPENMRDIMDAARYQRTRQWLLDIFFPPRNFEMSQDNREEAIGGSVVRVVTKSNVKGFGNPTPTIKEEELA